MHDERCSGVLPEDDTSGPTSRTSAVVDTLFAADEGDFAWAFGGRWWWCRGLHETRCLICLKWIRRWSEDLCEVVCSGCECDGL